MRGVKLYIISKIVNPFTIEYRVFKISQQITDRSKEKMSKKTVQEIDFFYF